MAKDPQYEVNVRAHVAAHKAKGETQAFDAHMKSPEHRAIVDAAADTVVDVEVPIEPDGAPGEGSQKPPEKSKGKSKDK